MKRWLILVLLMLPSTVAAQTSFYTDRALQQVNVLGTPTPLTAAIPFGSVRVCGLPLTQQSPCLPLATITDINGNPVSNNIGPLFGQLTTDSTGRYTFGCTNNVTYQVQVAASASNTPAVNFPVTCPGGVGTSVSANNAFTGNNSFTGATTTSNLNNMVVVDGVTYPRTNAGIQSAVNATPLGGTVYLPQGTYVLSGTGSEEILITQSIHFICAGWGTNLQATSAATATTDIIHVKPSGFVRDVVIQDCQIGTVSSGAGRYAISFDPQSNTANQVANAIVRHNFIGQVGNANVLGGAYSVAIINAVTTGNGTVWGSNFEDNTFLNGGLLLNGAGDSNNFTGNIVTGPSSGTTAGFELTQIAGAATNTFYGNNITTAGGCIIIHGATQPKFTFNQCEQTVTSTEANSAMVDLQGDSYAITDALVFGNNLNATSGGQHANINVRVANASNTIIGNDSISNSNTSALGAITTTAAASATQIFPNTVTLGGTAVALTDAGTGTGSFRALNNVGYLQFDDTGVIRTVLKTANTGSVSLFGYHGTLALSGQNGATYLYDGSGNPTAAMVAGGVTSAVPIVGTMFNVAALSFKEVTAPTAAANFDACYGDSTLHALKCSYNNGTFFQIPQVITATSAAFATATTAGTCVQSTTAVTGAATTMAVSVSPVSTPGVGAVWSAFVSSAGNVTINECAVATSAGGTIAFNIRVTP